MSVLRQADENLVTAFERIIELSPRPGRREADGLLSLSSGIPMGLFNPTYVVGDVTDPDAAIAAVGEHYASLDSPYAVTFRDEVAPGLAAACERAGLAEHWRMPLMVLDPIPGSAPEGASVDGLTVSEVDATAV